MPSKRVLPTVVGPPAVADGEAPGIDCVEVDVTRALTMPHSNVGQSPTQFTL